MEFIAQYFQNPSWVSAFISVLSLLVALKSVSIAIRESRAKALEAEGRSEDARRYAEALTVAIRAGNTMPQYLQRIAEQTSEVTELARKQIQETIGHLKHACDAADEIARELTQIGNEARRSQRDSVKAHQELLKVSGARQITPSPPSAAPNAGAPNSGGG